jgi:hypothetical protein
MWVQLPANPTFGIQPGTLDHFGGLSTGKEGSMSLSDYLWVLQHVIRHHQPKCLVCQHTWPEANEHAWKWYIIMAAVFLAPIAIPLPLTLLSVVVVSLVAYIRSR